jgi:hypothetical protein
VQFVLPTNACERSIRGAETHSFEGKAGASEQIEHGDNVSENPLQASEISDTLIVLIPVSPGIV